MDDNFLNSFFQPSLRELKNCSILRFFEAKVTFGLLFFAENLAGRCRRRRGRERKSNFIKTLPGSVQAGA
jgi:hypothetical protein